MSDNPQARERLIGNERIKLTATLLNNLVATIFHLTARALLKGLIP